MNSIFSRSTCISMRYFYSSGSIDSMWILSITSWICWGEPTHQHLLSCKLGSLIRSWLQHTHCGHMCSNFSNNSFRAAIYLQGDILFRPWFLLSAATNLELALSCWSIFIMLLNRPQQAYLNLSSVSPRYFLIPDSILSMWEVSCCHMYTKLQLTGKVASEETGLTIYYYSLCSFSLD